MYKQIVAYPYNGMIFTGGKGLTINMDESHRPYAGIKMPNTKEYIFHI